MKKNFFTILAVMLMSLTANAQHEYVDLGLPSGILWATSNCGSDTWSENDYATANWGSEWRTPTNSQWEELASEEYTTIEATTLNGVYGCKITSRSNGNSIFLPQGDYWTSNTFNDKVYIWEVSPDGSIDHCYAAPDYFCYYRPVRVPGPKYTISNIPSGWKVNGSTTTGTYKAEEGAEVIFTPKNIPAGKKIKSIKAVKK